MNKILHTKFGTAKINHNGYYCINGKMLHRLIWENFHNCKIKKGYVIHHKDGNKLNNCIMNLQILKNEDHTRLHTKGKKYDDELICGVRNTTGYYRVSKSKSKNLKQGFIWRYRYYDENGKQLSLCSVDIKKLEQKVKSKGLKWEEY